MEQRVPGGKDPAAEKDGHRKRLREKFLKSGLDGFLDYEILEILLTLGTPRRDCRETARRLLREYKTLRGVLEADGRELLKVQGLGPHNIFGLKLVREVSSRFLRDKMLQQALLPLLQGGL